VSLFDTFMAELLGRKVTPAQRRAAQDELDRIAAEILKGTPPLLPPPFVWVTFETTPGHEIEFQFTGQHRHPKPGEWTLQGRPPVMTQWLRGPKGSRFPIYSPTGRNRPRGGHRASQNAPPPPARPSEADKIHAALKTLGFADPTYSTSTVWPPPPGEIRAAFTAIARKDHPDRNPGDAAAEARYKEASAAYTLLKEHKLV